MGLNKGYHQTKEHTANRLASFLGYKHSEKTKKKISLARKGKKHSESHNKKISEALKKRGIGNSSTKICPRCKIEFPRESFKSRSNGYTNAYCKPCNNEHSMEILKKRLIREPEYIEKIRENNRKATLKRYHGVTIEIYDELLKKQNNGCAICGDKKSNNRQANLAIDHCHKTGNIRGLLCYNCNMLIGFAKDKVELLEKTIKYLKSKPSGYKSLGNDWIRQKVKNK